jgi:hypothetical protein
MHHPLGYECLMDVQVCFQHVHSLEIVESRAGMLVGFV